MLTQVRTWTVVLRRRGRALALGSVHQRPPRAGRLYRENRRRVRDPLSTPSPQKAHHPRGGEAQPGAGPTDFNSWPESGKDGRRGQRPHLVCRSWRDTRRESLPRECHGGLGRAARPPRQRQDSRRSRRCGAEGRPRPLRGTVKGSSPTFSCSTRQQANSRNMWLNSKPTTPTPSNAPAPSPKKSWRTRAKTP